jgi:U3 small nucleolar RNA-associated protein 14
MAEQHRLAQQLKQKVYAPGDETSDDDGTNSSSESESDSEDEDPEQRRKRAKQKALDALYQANGGDDDMPEGLSKGVFALPFMKRAQEKKKMETAEAAKAILEEMQREDDGDGSGDGSDDDDDLNIVDEKDAQEWQAIAEKAGAATMKKKSRTEKQSEQQQKEVEKKKAAAPVPAKTVPISKSARALRERAALRNRPPARFEKFEPVLMEDDEDEKKRKAAAMKKAELYAEPRHIAEKAEKEKQKKKAIANGTYVEEEGGDINDDASDFPTTAATELDDQKSLVSRAFAGDDVEEAFKKEKLKDIEEELPDVERPTLLPGWGAWEGERKSTPKWIIDQNKKADAIREKALKSRKDAKLKRVIISERYDKKAAAYNVEQLPRGYDSKAVYEGSMRTPLGADVNTDKQFRKLTKPKILKPSGAVIAPIKFPRNARPPTNDDESSKKKRRTKL